MDKKELTPSMCYCGSVEWTYLESDEGITYWACNECPAEASVERYESPPNKEKER